MTGTRPPQPVDAARASGHLRLLWGPLPQAHGVTDRVAQLGAVERIEMEFLDPVLLKAVYLFDRDVRRDHAAGFGIGVQAVEAAPQPFRNGRAAALGKPLKLREARDRQYPGNDLDGDAGCRAAVPVAQEDIGLEEELRDCAARPGVDLALQI